MNGYQSYLNLIRNSNANPTIKEFKCFHTKQSKNIWFAVRMEFRSCGPHCHRDWIFSKRAAAIVALAIDMAERHSWHPLIQNILNI